MSTRGTETTEADPALEAHRRELAARFGTGGDVRLFFSPGRINLMGAHLDYNGGPVMPMTVQAGTFVAVRRRKDRCLRLASTLDPTAHELDLANLPGDPTGSWIDYPLGVAREVVGRLEDPPPGLDLLFGGNLPIGAGLSSSASICVGTAFALDRVWQAGLSDSVRVDAALRAEREFVGVRCGIMDPFAVGYARPGHLLWLDCKDESFEHVPLDAARVRIAVVDTGVRRELAQSEFNRRVDECRRAFEALAPHVPGATCMRDVPRDVVEEHGDSLEPAVLRRARHVVDEVERTFAARAALRRHDLVGFGARMTAAHRSLANLFEVSVPELDCVVDTALAWEGVLGSRLTGAGFGGCAVVLLDAGACEGFETRIVEGFRRRFGSDPSVRFFDGDPGPREIAP